MARCIAIDLMGAGESVGDVTQDHGLGAQANVVEGLLDALGLERATVIGHDSGGSVARSFAVANPDRVSRLVIADTEVPGHRPLFVVLLQRLGRLPGSYALTRSLLRSKGLSQSKLGFGLCFANLPDYDFDEFFRLLVAPNARSEQALRATQKFLLDFDFEEVDSARALYDELRMPKYILWGEEDRIFPLKQGWRLQAMLPEPKRFDMIPGAGLFVHEEKPEAWVSALRSFLQYTAPA
jgi:pimeloyl-ACP methyl ester carboxylesterase